MYKYLPIGKVYAREILDSRENPTIEVEVLAGNGATRIGEGGPGKVLTGLVKRIDKSLDGRALGSLPDLESALEEWKA